MKRPRLTIILGLMAAASAAMAQSVESSGGVVFRGAVDPGSQAGAQLDSYLLLGQVGVGKDGMLVLRSTDGVPARIVESIRAAVAAENAERRARVREASTEEGDDAAQRLAAEWRAAAQPSWWVQTDEGRWQQGPLR